MGVYVKVSKAFTNNFVAIHFIFNFVIVRVFNIGVGMWGING